MQRRVEEFLLKEKALKVSAQLIFPGVIPIVLQAPLDDNASEKRALLETVRLFQTVSGIGCVYVNLHLYGVINMLFFTSFRSMRADKLAKAGARTLSDIQNRPELFKSLPKSVRTALKYQKQLIERIPRASVERIEALVRPLLTTQGFEVHFTGS